MIYLDYNATTPIDPEVLDIMRPFVMEEFGNPSSSHEIGQSAKEAMEAGRAAVAALIGARADEILFTSGGTEASNTAIKGVARLKASKGRHFVTTAVEHPATLEPMNWLEHDGYTRTEVAVDAHGRVDPEDIRKAIRPDTILISVMHAQNEVGTLEPIEDIGRIARQAGVLFHVDAAQSLGKVPVDVTAMQADFLTIAGHKLYAPKGVGALYIRRGLELEPLIHGAPQEHGRRGGTENVVMSVGLGRAAVLAAAYVKQGPHPELRDHLWTSLAAAFGDRVVLNGHPTERLPNTVNVSFPGHIGGEILNLLDGICASTGAACHAGDAKPSAVLTAMGFDRERSVGTIRFSVGRPTKKAEIDLVVEQLKRVLESR